MYSPSGETDKATLFSGARANAESAAVALNGAALVFQQGQFASAQGAVDKLRLRHNTGRLDMSAPSANASDRRRFRCVARATGGRHNFDGAGCQGNGSQGIVGKVVIDTEGE